MRIFTRLGIVILVLVLCTGCDQLTKNIARKTLASAAPISLLRGVVRIELAENPGGMLSLGAGLPGEARFLIFVVLVAIILPLTLVLALRANSVNLWQLIGLSMTAAGGLGNLLDRLFNQGVVIDFVSFGIGGLRTGIMNLADIAIVAGIVIFMLASTPENTLRRRSDPRARRTPHFSLKIFPGLKSEYLAFFPRNLTARLPADGRRSCTNYRLSAPIQPPRLPGGDQK